MKKKGGCLKGCLITLLILTLIGGVLMGVNEHIEKNKVVLTQEDYRFFDDGTSVPIISVVNGYLTIFTVEDANTAYTVSTNNSETFDYVYHDCFSNEKIRKMISEDEDLRWYEDAVRKFIIEAKRSNKALRSYADTLEPKYYNKIKDQHSRTEIQYSNILGYREDILKKCGYSDAEIEKKMEQMKKDMHAIN